MNKHVLRTKQKEQSILKATVTLVANQPIEHITIDKIKSAAKVSQVTIYKLFETKDNLINTAIKELSVGAVNSIMNVISSDINPRERLKEYFRTSFNTTLSYPCHKDILEYIFSGINTDLMNFVLSLYKDTYSHLERLYDDSRKENIVRSEISLQQFLKMCDMFTRTQPQFYQTDDEMNLLLESIVRSFG